MKKILLSSIIVLIGITFIGRLSYLQIFSFSPDQVLEDPAIKAIYDYPERGYIYDRNGKLLVGNDPAYDVMVIPREVKPLDTLEFCGLLGIDKEKFVQKLRKARIYSPRLPSVLVPQLSKEDYAMLQEKMRKYEGFYIQKRSLRYYDTKAAANVLGYIREVNERDLERNPYYVQGELTGGKGVEQQYEEILRGRKGVQLDTTKFDFAITPGRIIKNSYSSPNNYITINRGTNHGIKQDMGVITAKGILGIVEHTTKNYASVQSILNTKSNINAKIKNTNYFGSLVWDGRGYNQVKLEDIPRLVPLLVGDTIVTGAMSSIFPENIPIGTIKKFDLNVSKSFYSIDVELFNDMSNVKNIYIINNKNRPEILELEAKIANDQ